MKLWSNQIISLSLGRFPYDELDPSLQAWNGADTYLIEWASQVLKKPRAEVLVVNDSFGALACALIKKGHRVYSLTDSYISMTASIENLSRNGLDATLMSFVKFDEVELLGDLKIDLVLMQIPKSNGYYEFQLKILGSILSFGTALVVGGMTRDIHTSSSVIYGSTYGACKTSLANHKARLVIGQAEHLESNSNEPLGLVVSVEGIADLELKNYPGVFSSSSVDEASLLLAEYLVSKAQSLNCSTIIDCGCGNGFLGMVAARAFATAHIFCTDESYVAIASAKKSFEANGLSGRADFLWTDCLGGLHAEADLVLCNPPFHLGQSQTLAIAHRMFGQARDLMTANASLLVVANRHLGHDANLKNYFDRVEVVAESDRFMVIRAKSHF